MTIYNKTTLRNRFIKKQVEQAFDLGYMEKDLLNKIKDAHPVDLYSPNIIVSAGLGLLTALIVLASTGICMLLFNFGFNSTFFLIAGIVCYIYLEIVTGSKKHFNSGVDKVMMAASAIFIVSGLSIMFHTAKPDTWISFVLFLVCSWFAIRYVDMVAGCVAAFCLLVFSFNAYSYLGQFTIFTFPFILIAVSAGIYYVSNNQTKGSDYSIYYPVFKGIKILALCTFYLSGNYYIVHDIIQQNYILNAQSALSIAPWLYWGWTFAAPAIYVENGIKSKDITFLRLGIFFLAAAVVTFKFYFHVMSIEAALIVAGSIVICVSYFFMQYLRTSKRGFLFKAGDTTSKYADAEAFVLSQVVMPQAAPEQDTKFGGGGFGGAGSGTDF